MMFQMPETGEEDSDEDGDDDIPWLGYNEVSQVQKGKSLVKSRRPKQVVGKKAPRLVVGGDIF